MNTELTKKEAKELRKHFDYSAIPQKKKILTPAEKRKISEMRTNAICGILEGEGTKQPVKFDVMDRKIARNLFRAKYGNRKMKQAWANARIRSVGIVTYREDLIKTDPKGRHTSPRFPDMPQGAYAHDRKIRQRRTAVR